MVLKVNIAYPILIGHHQFINTGDRFMDNYPVKDKHYDLISTLYHAAKGVESTKQYAKDAEGDDDAVALFNEAMRSYQTLGDKARKLLKERLG